MHEKMEKFCFIFIQVSSYVSFSIAKCSQSTFCPLYHSNCGDMLPMTKVSSAECWHRWVSPCCSLQQHRDCWKRMCLWDTDLARRLFQRVSRRIWCISLQIFELLGKTHKNSHLMSIGTPQKQNYKNIKTTEVTHIFEWIRWVRIANTILNFFLSKQTFH